MRHLLNFLILLTAVIGLPFGWIVAWNKPIGKKLQTSFVCGVVLVAAVILYFSLR
jgi:hypothetical protein